LAKFEKIGILATKKLPEHSLHGKYIFNKYKYIFAIFFDFFEPRGTSLRAKGSLTERERETRRDHVSQNRSFGFQIGPARSKSVLIEIRPLMENPWNGEAASDDAT
jgi:hypothetical protein